MAADIFLELHTPWGIPCPIIDSHVMNAKDAGEIYPPGGSLFVVTRNDTLSSPDTKVCF